MGSFIKGTFFLMFVIFLSKLFGFVYRIQFMRIAGEEAVGLYMTSYPTFIFFISLIFFVIMYLSMTILVKPIN